MHSFPSGQRPHGTSDVTPVQIIMDSEIQTHNDQYIASTHIEYLNIATYSALSPAFAETW